MHESEPRDAAAVRIFPPAIPLAAVLLGVLLNRLWPIEAAWMPDAPLRYWLGGLVMVAANLGLGFTAVRLMRSTGQSENPWKPTTEIVAGGPYRFTRNPMYLQMVLMCAGLGIVLGNAWILLLTPLCAWALFHFVIRHEEAYLERKFGEDYLAYKRRVRRWL